ncbi:MAG: lysophospholipid acyltransferase family protein [Planctomycetota bacterium]
MNYVCARTILYVLSLFPDWLSYRFAGALGRLFFRCSKRRQDCALRILHNAYPGQNDDRVLLDLARRSTGNLFKVSLDTVRLTTAIRRGRLHEVIDMSQARALIPPAPFLGVTGHLGSWEVGAVAMAQLTHEVHAIVRTFRNPLLTDFVFASRRLAGLHLHPRRGGIAPLAAALRRGAVGVQAADQYQRLRGIQVPFFGELASTERGAVSLALRGGYPILVGRCERVGVGFRFRVVLSEPFVPEATGGHQEDVRRAAAEVNRRLEEHILACPDQYLWIHDRYRHRQQRSHDPEATR